MSTALTSYMPVIQVSVCGKTFELHRASDLESLWDAMTKEVRHSAFEDDERLPYWTELWPSSVALCGWLYSQRERIAGAHCLDVGCGLGLTALVGQWLGAKVLAMDYEEDALHFAFKNAEVNGISQPLWTVMDWRRPAVQKGSIDFLWGGDIMYERGFVHPVLNFIDYALAKNGVAWIAEPCRSVYEFFRAEIVRRKWVAKRVYEAPVEALYAQDVPVTVQVWELRR